jgi:hypothetical protein
MRWGNFIGCKVRFACNGIYQCEFRDSTISPDCRYLVEGYCTNKEAQIKSLQDEGFEILDESEKQAINDLITLADGGYYGDKDKWKETIKNLLKKARVE